MAGYLATMDSVSSLRACLDAGIYSPQMTPGWSSATVPTLGDFETMRPGDSLYFFSKRRIYGIARLVDAGGGRCAFENFPRSTRQKAVNLGLARSASISPCPIEGRVGRWAVCFRPSPAFLPNSVDMDDLLESDPHAFRSLRTFWKRSFVQLDDDEDQAFRAALLRSNRGEFDPDAIDHEEPAPPRVLAADAPDIQGLLRDLRRDDGSLGSEAALEAALIHQLRTGDPETIATFGEWDYVSHQVPASPFKPVDYMDRMDLFGYRWIRGYKPIVEKYLVAELKKGDLRKEDVLQAMKYVEWVRREYASGDYSLVSAFLVAHRVDEELVDQSRQLFERDYVTGREPPEGHSWRDLTFVEYGVDEDGHVAFQVALAR